MTRSWSPFSFLFMLCWFLCLIILFFIPNIFLFWILMEVMLLIFMGLSYSYISMEYSCIMSVFLVQALASFGLLAGILFSSSFLFTLFCILKLAIFPFHHWMVGSVYTLPSGLFLFLLSWNKFPLFLLISLFSLDLEWSMLFTCGLLSFLYSGIHMIMLSSVRSFLAYASIGNNMWFFLSLMYGFPLFLTLFLYYFIFSYCILFMSDMVLKSVSSQSVSSFLLISSMLFLSGLPPFPMFFIKLAALLGSLSLPFISSYLLLFILSASLMLIGYVSFIFKYVIYSASYRVYSS